MKTLVIKRSDFSKKFITFLEGYEEEHEERAYRHIGSGDTVVEAIGDWLDRTREANLPEFIVNLA